MRIRRRRASVLFVAAAAAVACRPSTSATGTPASQPAPSDSPKSGGTLTIGISRDAGELDPPHPTGSVTRQYARALFNALTDVDLQGNVTGELAESWSAEDPTTYLLHLAQGVKFQDGTPFDADAVKYNFDYMLNPQSKAFYRAELTGIVRTDVVDPQTVRLRLRVPDGTVVSKRAADATVELRLSAVNQLEVQTGWGSATVRLPRKSPSTEGDGLINAHHRK